MISFNCPLCNAPLQAPDGRAGSTVGCHRCRRPITVPAGIAAPASPQQSRGVPIPAAGKRSRMPLALGCVAAVVLIVVVGAVIAVTVVVYGAKQAYVVPSEETYGKVGTNNLLPEASVPDVEPQKPPLTKVSKTDRPIEPVPALDVPVPPLPAAPLPAPVAPAPVVPVVPMPPVKEADKFADLVKGLQAKTPAARVNAARELGKHGKEAATAARAICIALGDPAKEVKQAAAEALEKVRPDLYGPVVALVVGQPESKDIRALAKMKAEASPAIPILLHVARTTGADITQVLSVYHDAVLALAVIAPNDEDVIAFLAKSGEPISDTTNVTTINVSYARRRVSLQALCSAAQTSDRAKKEAISLLEKALTERAPRRDLRVVAVTLAGDIGPDAKPLLPHLKSLKLDADAVVRKAAADAVEKIDK